MLSFEMSEFDSGKSKGINQKSGSSLGKRCYQGKPFTTYFTFRARATVVSSNIELCSKFFECYLWSVGSYVIV